MRKIKVQFILGLIFLFPSIVWAGGGFCETGMATCTGPGADAFCANQCGDCWRCSDPTLGGVCIPDSTFCDAISGGDQENLCRNTACIEGSFFNPTGCDYSYDTANASQACQLCDPPPPGYSTCGNGICERILGETCTNCVLDCLAPGFPLGTCPFTDQATLDLACQPPPSIKFIGFPGPDYNQPNTNRCEDGDICTNDICVDDGMGNIVCDSGDLKPCDNDFEDLCCPPGCNPPADPSVGCVLGEINCDVDCLGPIECPFCGNNIIDPGEQCDGTAPNNCGVEGCNNATCQCNPPIVTVGVCTQGSGCGNNSGNAPGDCDGFTTIGQPKVLQFFNEWMAVWLLVLAIGSVWAFKRRWQ